VKSLDIIQKANSRVPSHGIMTSVNLQKIYNKKIYKKVTATETT
jgi:hypothetical protein